MIWFIVKSQEQRNSVIGMYAVYRTLDEAVNRAVYLAKKLKQRMYVVIFEP